MVRLVDLVCLVSSHHLALPTLTRTSVQKQPQRSRLKGGGAGDRPVGVLDREVMMMMMMMMMTMMMMMMMLIIIVIIIIIIVVIIIIIIIK